MRIAIALLVSVSLALANPLVVLSGNPPTATTPLTTNLVAYYKLDEAGGSVDAVDIHAGKTLVQHSGPGTASGVISTARTSTNTNHFFDRADDTSFEPGSSPFFVTMWVKPSNLTQATHPAIFGKWTSSGNQREWGVWFVSGGGADIIVSGNGSTFVEEVVGSTFTDTTTWKFIAAGWDGTNLKISINGGAFATEPFAGPLFTGTATICMFTRDAGAVSFQGAVDEVAFWKGRALTLAEVQTIYNSGAGKAYSTW